MMTMFALANWLTTVVTAAILFLNIARRRELLVKPSVWFVLFFHVQIQWASAALSEETFKQLSSPWVFFVLTQLLPLSILLLSFIVMPRQARFVWQMVLQNSPNTGRVTLMEFCGLVMVWLGIVSIYLAYVPFRTTGLWVSFTSGDSSSSIWAREESLKLISSPLVRYLYAYNAGFLCALLAAITGIAIVRNYRNRPIIVPVGLTFIALILISAMLSGARAEGAVVILGVALAFWFKAGCRFKARYALVSLFLVLTPPIVVDIVRQGVDIDSENVWISKDTILARVFVLPTEVGLSWIRYVEENGYWGVAGIPKLAYFAGVEPISVQNYMAQVEFPDSKFNATAQSNTSFVFSYYSFFGPAVVPLLIPAVLLLDLSLLVVKYIAKRYTVLSISILALSMRSLVEADYTTLFISFGFLTSLLTLFILGILNPDLPRLTRQN